jgi:hypothetical protein
LLLLRVEVWGCKAMFMPWQSTAIQGFFIALACLVFRLKALLKTLDACILELVRFLDAL